MTVLPDQPSGPSARPTGRDHPVPARGVPAGQGPGRPHPSAVRVARQVGVPASLPPVFGVVLIALDVVPVTLALAVGAAVLLLVLDVAGWPFVSRLFDRERLITGSS